MARNRKISKRSMQEALRDDSRYDCKFRSDCLAECIKKKQQLMCLPCKGCSRYQSFKKDLKL